MPVMIQVSDPRAEYLAQRDEIDAAIARVLSSGRLILGPEVDAFEREFAQFLSAGECIAVANGTDAIELALRACGIGDGDVVATVSHTAVATVTAIRLAGATPLFVDVDAATLTMDASALRTAIEAAPRAERIKAVIPVHLYGGMCDMEAVMRVAREFRLRVIEDSSQAHGALLHGRSAGTWGDLGTFSFYPTKNLGALGDGGAVVTGDGDLAARLRELRQYGWRERNISQRLGRNSRLDEMQAAVLRVKLTGLAAGNARRRQNAAAYGRSLQGLPVTLPGCVEHCVPVFHQYVIRTGKRAELQAALRQAGAESAIHYPVPAHRQKPFETCVGGPLAVTEAASAEILSVPVHPHLRDADVATVASVIRTVCDG